MVKLLHGLVVDVSITLDVRYTRERICFEYEAVKRLENRAGLRELVEITHNNYAREGVELQDRLDKCLWAAFSMRSVRCVLMQGKTYSDRLHLECALVDVAVERRTRIALHRRTTIGFRCIMDVDGEKALSVGRLPSRNQGLAADVPGDIRGIDASGIESTTSR